MKTQFKISKNAFLICSLLCLCSFGDPKVKKASGARCTGSKYCTACTNCSRCQYCGSGGVCGVCSPESFEEKPKPAPKKRTSANYKQDTLTPAKKAKAKNIHQK